MSRITIVEPDQARPEAKLMLDAVQAQLGMVPNFVKLLAVAPAALEGFLGLYTIAGKGVLDPHTRERIALAVAETNQCEYCVSAHSAISRSIGLGEDEIAAARQGISSERKAAAAVRFARALVASMGAVSATEFSAARAELSEEELVEVIAHVALNIFTNLLGKSTKVEIDFPREELLAA